MSPSSFYDDLHPGFGGKCWQVHKFGGTSVADAKCFIQVAEIIEDQIDIDTDVVHYGDLNSQTNLAVSSRPWGGNRRLQIYYSVRSTLHHLENMIKWMLN